MSNGRIAVADAIAMSRQILEAYNASNSRWAACLGGSTSLVVQGIWPRKRYVGDIDIVVEHPRLERLGSSGATTDAYTQGEIHSGCHGLYYVRHQMQEPHPHCLFEVSNVTRTGYIGGIRCQVFIEVLMWRRHVGERRRELQEQRHDPLRELQQALEGGACDTGT